MNYQKKLKIAQSDSKNSIVEFINACINKDLELIDLFIKHNKYLKSLHIVFGIVEASECKQFSVIDFIVRNKDVDLSAFVFEVHGHTVISNIILHEQVELFKSVILVNNFYKNYEFLRFFEKFDYNIKYETFYDAILENKEIVSYFKENNPEISGLNKRLLKESLFNF